jgi:hypothetical protein
VCVYIYIYIYTRIYNYNEDICLLSSFVCSFSFQILFWVGRTSWTVHQPVTRPVPYTRDNINTQTSMLRLGFEPTTPAFERKKTIHILDRAATLIGFCIFREDKFKSSWNTFESKTQDRIMTFTYGTAVSELWWRAIWPKLRHDRENWDDEEIDGLGEVS